jgi:A/G-specific adenine glycosylase
MRRAPISVGPRLAASPFTGREVSAFRRVLLRWYDKHRRQLPWRETSDPYRIWLSEVMLQQTRVAAVLEHYRVFLERFPTVQALAAAPLDAVLAAWSGLGYYRRARLLHQCAREIVRQYGGQFPREFQEARTLPGIGRYTAAAIASIAFSEPVAVVDGNVERVVKRLVDRELGQSKIWQGAQTLLSPLRPGDFNQAMMELGATVCLPRNPGCASCPVRKWCATQGRADQSGRDARPQELTVEQRPVSANGRQVKKDIWCTLDERAGRVRLVQRPAESSFMPGMWELPQESRQPRSMSGVAPWRVFRHSITVTDYTVHVLRRQSAAKGKWVAIPEVNKLPLTGLTRKVLRASGII